MEKKLKKNYLNPIVQIAFVFVFKKMEKIKHQKSEINHDNLKETYTYDKWKEKKRNAIISVIWISLAGRESV